MPVLRTVLVLLLSGTVTVAGQSARPPEVLQETWQNAVDTHVPGQIDQALRTIAMWSFDDVMGGVVRTPLCDARLARALALHTDLAIVYRELQPLAEQGVGGRRVLRDGRDDGRAVINWHWEVGRELIRRPVPSFETINQDPACETPFRLSRDAIVRAWLDATCALFLSWADYAELTRQLTAARSWREQFPELLLYEGTLHQAYADARVQAFRAGHQRWRRVPNELQRRAYRRPGIGVDEDPSSTPEERQAHPDDARMPSDASRERKQAEALFRKALERDSGLHEARIRLAHVLIDQGRPDAAAPLLHEALASSLEPFLEYYGALLLGRLHEGRGDLAAARERFERAARLFPTAQTPRIALSRIALLQGRVDEALAFLAAGDEDAAAPPQDPWWFHLRLRAPDADSRLASFFAAVRR